MVSGEVRDMFQDELSACVLRLSAYLFAGWFLVLRLC